VTPHLLPLTAGRALQSRFEQACSHTQRRNGGAAGRSGALNGVRKLSKRRSLGVSRGRQSSPPIRKKRDAGTFVPAWAAVGQPLAHISKTKKNVGARRRGKKNGVVSKRSASCRKRFGCGKLGVAGRKGRSRRDARLGRGPAHLNDRWMFAAVRSCPMACPGRDKSTFGAWLTRRSEFFDHRGAGVGDGGGRRSRAGAMIDPGKRTPPAGSDLSWRRRALMARNYPRDLERRPARCFRKRAGEALCVAVQLGDRSMEALFGRV